ncbi:MAG: LacI family transcriptional regulator [Bacteroidetes bacterium]|nr:LacI family transcriptional regulator [Bacteroidota bacterium]
MKNSITEIARRADVSIATVSRALNNDSRVKESTRNRIQRIAREINYRPNLLARGFALKRSNIIGLIMPELVDEYFTEVIKGVEAEAIANGYYTMVASTHNREGSIVDTLDRFSHNRMVDGLILLTTFQTAATKRALGETGIPLVVIGDDPLLTHADVVKIDNFQGAYSLISYLVSQKGYRKIAHITGPPGNLDANRRKEGYLAALAKLGLEINPAWMVEGQFTIESGKSAFQRLMSLNEKPDLIFAANDRMAIGCYEGAGALGLRIPTDIGIAGFDDIFVSRFLTPRLTTVGVPITEVGKTAASLLLSRLAGTEPLRTREVIISTGIVPGDSV